MLDKILSHWPERFRRTRLPVAALRESDRRVLDAWGCAMASFDEPPVRRVREALGGDDAGPCGIWGSAHRASPMMAAWINATAVRALDFNDTYLSLEPCHPSDLIPALWAACAVAGGKHQGALLRRSVVLAYEVVCRLCDAASIRIRGWDHVTYLPIASAVGCSFALGLSVDQTRNAIALAASGNHALRQTRVGTISDWKASCAGYAASAGLWAALLARRGFSGPSDIFEGRHGFFRQVSGPLRWKNGFSTEWKIVQTHIKYFPAEHHAQSAIEAAILLRRRIGKAPIRSISIDTFDVGVAIIGGEKEKWRPRTRETADHSLPYLVVAALLDGTVSLDQFRRRRFLSADVRRLLSRVTVKASRSMTARYPVELPARVTVALSDGRTLSAEVGRPRGYRGRSLSDEELASKFSANAARHLSPRAIVSLTRLASNLADLARLDAPERWMRPLSNRRRFRA